MYMHVNGTVQQNCDTAFGTAVKQTADRQEERCERYSENGVARKHQPNIKTIFQEVNTVH